MKINNQGFTVVELLVSIIVAAILITSVSTILTTHTYISQQGRDLALANAFAEAKVETLRSIGYLGLSDGTTDITSELPSELSSPRTASQQISSYTNDIKAVTLSITYNEQGKSKTHTYKTFVGELGVGQY
jgi:prepilin-type N-terminal cleavage/methylation domain-containing protein